METTLGKICILLLLTVYNVISPVSAAVVPTTFPDTIQHNRFLGETGQGKDSLGTSLLDVIEVDVPVKVPRGAGCSVVLMKHSFANSYGLPFIGSYIPPPCDFNRVVFNFTVTSAGRQFDRLAIMYLNDTEVWRTSTAEPTASGIVWTYNKDMSHLLALFKKPQKVIFDLGNLVNDIYTGPFNTTLTATFFEGDIRLEPADLIVPVSARRSGANQGSAWVIPETTAAVELSIPRNVRKAVFSMSACGQAAEEFWWSNVPSSTTTTFVNNTLYGFSPFREVQLLIDGSLAGVVWPFPVIFTGGIVPSFWRPLVGLDTYDLREDEIDITPWLPLLSDGKKHNFAIRVLGIADSRNGKGVLTSVGNYWVVSGKVFLWLDDEDSITTGSLMSHATPAPELGVAYTLGKDDITGNTSLGYYVYAKRQLSIQARVSTSEGVKYTSWKQVLSYSNTGNVTAGGYDQSNIQSTKGYDASSSGYVRRFSYPLSVFSSYSQDSTTGAFNLSGILDRSKNVQIFGESTLLSGLEQFDPNADYDGSQLSSRQTGSASWSAQPDPKKTRAWATTEQQYDFEALFATSEDFQGPTIDDVEALYSRHVKASNGTIVKDHEVPATEPIDHQSSTDATDDEDDDDDDDEEGELDVDSFASARIDALCKDENLGMLRILGGGGPPHRVDGMTPWVRASQNVRFGQ